MSTLLCTLTGGWTYAVQVSTSDQCISNCFLSSGSIVVGCVYVLDRITVGSHIVPISCPVPVVSQDRLQNIWIGTCRYSVESIIRAHDRSASISINRGINQLELTRPQRPEHTFETVENSILPDLES